MSKTNDSGVPFLSGKRKVTEKYRDNYNKIDWSKTSNKDKQESTKVESTKEKENG